MSRCSGSLPATSRGHPTQEPEQGPEFRTFHSFSRRVMAPCAMHPVWVNVESRGCCTGMGMISVQIKFVRGVQCVTMQTIHGFDDTLLFSLGGLA